MWRDRIIICSARSGPPQPIIDALLDCGARAVIAPPPSLASLPAAASGLVSPRMATLPAPLPSSSTATPLPLIYPRASSQSRTSSGGVEGGRCGDRGNVNLDEWIVRHDTVFGLGVEKELALVRAEEERTSEFLHSLYDGLFEGGMNAQAAVAAALKQHPGMMFFCHSKRH